MDFLFSLQRILLSAEGWQKSFFSRTVSRNVTIRVSGRGTSQLNLAIGRFFAQPGARAGAVPKFVLVKSLFCFLPSLGSRIEAQPKLFGFFAPDGDSP
jgi:hypothetical protein